MHKEPLIASQLPSYPWQVEGSDLFELEGEHHIIVVDYFSQYPEVIKLKSSNSVAVINALKAVFSRYGIPEILRTDNGPQCVYHNCLLNLLKITPSITLPAVPGSHRVMGKQSERSKPSSTYYSSPQIPT